MIEEIVFGNLSSTGFVLLRWVLGALFTVGFVYAAWTQSLKSRNGPVSEESKRIALGAGCLCSLPVLLIGYYMSFASFHTVSWDDQNLELHYRVPSRTKRIPWSKIEDIGPYLTTGKGDHRKHALVYTCEGDSYYSFAANPQMVKQLESLWRKQSQEKS